MQRKKMLKRNSIRHAEYYNMVEIQDRLFQESKDDKGFHDLICIIASEQNIKLAYRNLKTNKGSNTAGVDGKTFEDLKQVSDLFIYEKYKKSKQIWYINGYILAPIAYCRHRNPMCHRSTINQYTPEGRIEIHKMLNKEAYSTTLFELSQSRNPERSMEYSNNRLSRFVAVQGKCEITGVILTTKEVHCHHWKPVSFGGTDEYSNLRIVHENVHRLIHATTKETILKYLELTGCREKGRLAKVNKWRKTAGLEPILLTELN